MTNKKKQGEILKMKFDKAIAEHNTILTRFLHFDSELTQTVVLMIAVFALLWTLRTGLIIVYLILASLLLLFILYKLSTNRQKEKKNLENKQKELDRIYRKFAKLFS